MIDEIERCERCGWPIVPEGEAGCWKSNCSMRPMPPLLKESARSPLTDAERIELVREVAKHIYVLQPETYMKMMTDGTNRKFAEVIPFDDACAEAISDALEKAETALRAIEARYALVRK